MKIESSALRESREASLAEPLRGVIRVIMQMEKLP